MPQPKIVALEEHFTSPRLRELRGEKDTPLQRKLDDLGALRIREMDEAGIDLQILSENNPATQNLDPESAVTFARASNDALHHAVRAHPGDAVIALGGDGTVHTVLQALDLARQTLGIVPLGSGNDMYRNLGLPVTIEAALAPLLAGTRQAWDVGTVGELRFLNSAGAGLDAHTLETRERSRGWIRKNYSALFLKTLTRIQPFPVRITIDGVVREQRGWWFIVANGPWIGGGMHIAPGGSVRDGRFEILCIGEVSKWTLVQALPKVFKGAHLGIPGIELLHGAEVEFATPEAPQRIAVDGELAMATPVTFRLLPGALQVFGP